jgi:hypothetical protein
LSWTFRVSFLGHFSRNHYSTEQLFQAGGQIKTLEAFHTPHEYLDLSILSDVDFDFLHFH